MRIAGFGMALLLRPVIGPAQTIAVNTRPGKSARITKPNPDVTLYITLKDAIKRARVLSPAVQLAVTNAKVAAEKPSQAFSSNLPTVSSNSQYLYTEGNGTPSARYIANNGVHEYIAQVDVHQSLSLANIIFYRKSIAAAALSRDRLEIARRGLVVAVVQAYSTLVAAKQKYRTEQESAQAAEKFLKVTRQLEQGGEVAHADVVKAQIQYDDSQIALQDTIWAGETARAELAMMLFPDINQRFDVVDDPAQVLSLPDIAEVKVEARHNNPSLDAAFKADRVAIEDVKAAKAEYLPTMTLDYFYGIDANHFAETTPSNPRVDPELHGMPIQNLGYSALASLTVPIWNWGRTRSRVKSAEILESKSELDLQFAQRKLISNLERFYGEAKVAQSAIEIRRQAVASAADSQKLTMLQYKAGDATALEVVSAQTILARERNALSDAEMHYAMALANLSTLTGSL